MKRSTILLTLIGAATLGTSPAQAGETCYDFAKQPVGTKYTIGETIQAEHLKVRITDYMLTGVKANPGPGAQFVEVSNTSLAGSTGPELYSYLATMRIQPHTPVAQIRMRVGESQGGPYQGHANIEFNGAVREVTGSLALLDGKEWGDGAGNSIRIESRQALRGGHRYDGMLKVRAVSGEIKSFGIGGAALAVDDVCFTPNAP
jgi:hypothetical protein